MHQHDKRNSRDSLRDNNDAGVILLVVIWMMVILSMLALGLGRRTRIDLALTKHAVGATRARQCAWAGLVYAMEKVQKDSQDPDGKDRDTLYACGVSFDEEHTARQVFENITLGDGYFAVSYISNGDHDVVAYGLQDEERRINLNALNKQNAAVLRNLIILLGFDDDTASTVTASVVDWHDADTVVTDEPFGAEDEYYESMAHPYRCKDAAFDSIAELMLVKGVTPEVFSRIKEYVTVFPRRSSRLLINVNTASAAVLRAVARSVAGAVTNTEDSDADSLVEKIIRYRSGEDGVPATADDRAVESNELGLNAKEQAIFLSIKRYLSDTSDYVRAQVTGTDRATGVSAGIEAVVYRDDLSIVSWQRR